MRNKIIFLSLSLLFFACSVPEGARESGEEAIIFPDYKGVVIPPNISPLDFKILNDGERYVTTISGEKAGTITVRGCDVKLPSKEWKALVEANKGSDIVYTVNVKRKGEWLKLAQFKGTVVEDPIDDYMVYRLLAPSYEFYTAFSIRQRNLSTGEDREVYNNRMHYNPKEQQCMRVEP